MDSTQLREYLEHILKLESAIYQTNQFKNQYQEKRANEKTKEQVFYMPTKPREPKPLVEYVSFSEALRKLSPTSPVIWGLSFAVSFFCIMFSIAMRLALNAWTDIQTTMLIIGLMATVPCAYTTYQTIQFQKKLLQSIIQKNSISRAIYQDDLEAYTTHCANIQEKKAMSSRTHAQAITIYDQETNTTLNRLAETETTLKASLYTLYSQNVIYAKYRNFVAVATLFEYIDSGRCFQLEGPNGAYNLYEGELRSDVIISSLNNIISNLEAIRNNQYTLYQSIENANATTRELLLNINDSQMLTAYYAQQTAIAASADRYIVPL